MKLGKRIVDGRGAVVLVAAMSVLAGWAEAAPPEIRWAQGPGFGSWNAQTDQQRSYLGVGVREIDAARAKEKGLGEAYGVEITKVEPDSAADKAGVQKGDVVVEYGGRRVEGVEQFKRLVRETPVGRKVTLKVNRDGQSVNLDTTIGSCEKCAAMVLGSSGEGNSVFSFPQGFDVRTFSLPDVPRVFTTWRSSMLGIEAEALQAQLAEYFGVSQGVLVRSVMKGSAAEKAGFQAGDVIVKVAGRDVATPREVTLEIQNRQQSQFDVVVMRNHAQVTLSVRLEERRSGEGRLEPFQMVSASTLHL